MLGSSLETTKTICFNQQKFERNQMKKLSLLDLEKRIRKLEKTVVLLKKHRRTQIRLDLDGEDSIDIVQKVTCEVWNVTLEQLLSKSDDANLVHDRTSAR